MTFSENHWSNTEMSVQFFNKIIFLYIEKVKKEKYLPTEQMSLIIMDTFNGQDNDTILKLCQKNNCVIVIVPQIDFNLQTYLSKSFLSNEYNQWFSERVAAQLGSGKLPSDVKIYLKLLDIKSLHAN